MTRGSRVKKCVVMITAMVVLITTFLLPQNMSVAAGEYNYGEALQKAIMFYEFQMAGKQPDWIRNNWRSDACLNDGKDVGVDLTKGWFDAGDHVKFNLPMSYSVAMLAWSIYEYKDAFVKSGQLDYLLREMKWATDYLVNCHPEPNVYYFEVGHGGGGYDHRYWGAAETVEQAMIDLKLERITYKADLTNKATTVVASTSAALAAAAIVFKEKDPTYSQILLKHAKELYTFADTTKSTVKDASDTYYNSIAGDFYKSWSGPFDQLAWACVWLNLATGDASYIEKAESYVPSWGRTQDGTLAYKWGHNWDDVVYGTELLLARITKKAEYKEAIERNLDWWTVGYKGEKIKYTPKGLAWLDTWGSLRYATTTAFLASVYADSTECTPDKASIYKDFAKKQVDYALGSAGRSYVIGFGTDYPQFPHHRTAHGSWSDDKTVPGYTRHVIVGALVGGPDATDAYKDDNGAFQFTEVACDYNAGFVGILAKMYQLYGGTPIPNLTAVEQKKDDEYFVDASVGSSGANFVGIKATLRNRSAWPAKVCYNMSFKYFMDLSELINQGIKPESLKASIGYSEGNAKISAVLPWDTSKNIYYVKIEFPGSGVYPGGQSAHRREAQFRIEAPTGTTGWDNTNDFSFQGLPASVGGTTTAAKAPNIPVYNDDKLLGGKEAPNGNQTPPPTTPPTTPPPSTPPGAKVSGYVGVDFAYAQEVATQIKSGFKVEVAGTNISTVTDVNGYFVLNNVPLTNQGEVARLYDVIISKKNYLTRTIGRLQINGDKTLSTQALPTVVWAGDMEINGIQDTAVNMSDIMEVARVFNSTKGDSRYVAASDFDCDGAINMTDIMIVAKHFNATFSSYSN